MKNILLLILLIGYLICPLSAEQKKNPIPRELRPVLHVTGGALISYVTALGLEILDPEKVTLGERGVVGICMGTFANFVKEGLIDHTLGYKVSALDIGLGFGGSVLGAGCYYLQEVLQKRKKERKVALYISPHSARVVYTF